MNIFTNAANEIRGLGRAIGRICTWIASVMIRRPLTTLLAVAVLAVLVWGFATADRGENPLEVVVVGQQIQ